MEENRECIKLSSAGISIVIPAYNEENFIGATLDSIENSIRFLHQQKNIPWEVVVVNNQSTDRTEEISVAKGARVLNFSKRNISAVRNHGIREASYDLIITIDADCKLDQAAIAKIVEYFSNEKNIGASLNLKLQSESFYKRTIASILQFIVFNISGIKGAVFAFKKHEALSFGGFPEDKLIAEDSAFAFLFRRRAKEQGKKFGFIRSAEVSTIDRKDMSLFQVFGLSIVLLKALFGFKLNEKNLSFWYKPDR